MRFLYCAFFAAALLIVAPAGVAQYAPNRYALLLRDPPVAARYSTRGMASTSAALDYQQQILTQQRALRAELSSRQVQVTGSASTLTNAIFVAMPEPRVEEMRSLPGVAAVVRLRMYRRSMNRAAGLINAPAAWSALGGQANGGAGIKIAILDTGIDQTHPAFQDSSLSLPPGYPRCSGNDCAFTNNKVIAARSYVRMLAAGSSPTNPAADSRPDDYSPVDREGHGTAVASAAAGVFNSSVVGFSGVAPKAWLGNYKIYGSPELNDFSSDDVIIQALEDAMADRMDIVSLSTGSSAFTGPLDAGSACGNPAGVVCDISAAAFENAAQAGMIIVAAAGNEGNDGLESPTYGSVSSPATAPSVIAVGASTNTHYFTETVNVPGGPAGLQGIVTGTGDAYVPLGAVTAPLKDVSTVGDELACEPLPAGSLAGAFALILRGTCDFSIKVAIAEQAGAIGVILYMADTSPLVEPGGLLTFLSPVAMVSNADGLALKSYFAANPGAKITLDPNGAEHDYEVLYDLASFSSQGPTLGDFSIKPELIAPGTSVYMATQNYDPLSLMYSTTRYLSASGTSFATPIVSGAAALIKQAHPSFTAAQVKSALINTTSPDIKWENPGIQADVRGVGAGKLDAGAAVRAAVIVSPVTISFGEILAGTLPLTRQLQVRNLSSTPVSLTLAVASAVGHMGTNIGLDKTSLSLLPNALDTATLTLSGAAPSAGSYYGAVTVQGTGVSLRIPYMFVAGNGAVKNLHVLAGNGFDGTVGQVIPTGILAFKAIDDYGVPVRNLPVNWEALTPGGRIIAASSATDRYGIAMAQPALGLTPGTYRFSATVANNSPLNFSGHARLSPTITTNGVVNAATFEPGSPVAPGSYIAIFGTGLSDSTNPATTARLPMSIDYATVSFDVPSADVSVPGRLTFASPGQVNVQVPWELQGQSSAQVKVTIDFSPGNVVTVPLADYAPAFFEVGGGVPAALDLSNAVITSTNPAVRGQVIQLFANGLGPVTNRPASGEPALSQPLSETTTKPGVMIGGLPAAVAFSGLTPTLPGLYQINVTVPDGLAAGTQSITVGIGGKTSKSASLPVK